MQVDFEKSGLVAMLEMDLYDDLHRMYRLFREVQGGAELLKRCAISIEFHRFPTVFPTVFRLIYDCFLFPDCFSTVLRLIWFCFDAAAR